MKKFIFLLLTAVIAPHSTNYARNNERRNVCIGLAAVVTIGYLGYRYYSSDNTTPTEPEKDSKNQNDETSKIIIEPSINVPKINIDLNKDLNKPEISEEKGAINPKSENGTPFTSHHSDLAKKVHCGLEALYSNLHQADIEAIFARNICILEG